MAEEATDPRETPLHPRFCQRLVGHKDAVDGFERVFSAGKPHHAWLFSGPKGIGKASMAYRLAKSVLTSATGSTRAASWLAVRAHPDFHVLELSVSDAKTGKLKSEISVEDVHAFASFFGRTSGQGGWRVGLVDCADDLNREGANALLKLVEEPPDRSLIFIVNHEPGRLLHTLRSRCLRLPLKRLTAGEVEDVLSRLPLEDKPTDDVVRNAAELCSGSAGRALELLQSVGAQAFRAMTAARQLDAATRHGIGALFANKATLPADYRVFMDLVLGWAGDRALSTPASGFGLEMARLSGTLLRRRGEVESYNLDRRTAVLETLNAIQDVLKAA